MARVEITEDELKSGAFPAVCAKSGEPTKNIEELHIRLPHPDAVWLVFAALIPYVAYRCALAPRLIARMPMSRPIVEFRNRQHTYLLAIGTFGTALATIGLLLPEGVARVTAVAIGLAVAIVTQVVLVAWRREASIRFSRTRDDTVVLDRIHPAFRDALATGGVRRPTPTDPPAGPRPSGLQPEAGKVIRPTKRT